MSSQVVTLTPGQTAQPQLGWQAKSANINNQSNCWLTYAGQYIISPYQQSIYPFPSGDAAPLLALTSTAPAGQQNQPAPVGTCYVTLTDEVQAANPGVVSAQLTTQQNQALLGQMTITPTTPAPTTVTIDVPPWVQSLKVACASAPAVATTNLLIQGHQTGITYFDAGILSGSTANNSTSVFDFNSAIDASADMTMTAPNPGTNVTVSLIGLPGEAIVDIGTNPVNVSVANGITVAADTPAIDANLVTGITGNGTTTLTLVSGGIQSITVFNANTGSCTIELVGVTSGFQYIQASALASQASLTADIFRILDLQVNLIITATAGSISVGAVGNLYPAQGGGGSSGTSNPTILSFGSNPNDGTVPTNATVFLKAGASSATEAQQATPVATAVTITKLAVVCQAAPGAGQTYTYTLRKNGADTAITATISGAAATSANGSGSVALAAGDTWSCKLVTSNGSTATTHNGSIST